jgi:hypothetical protein
MEFSGRIIFFVQNFKIDDVCHSFHMILPLSILKSDLIYINLMSIRLILLMFKLTTQLIFMLILHI